MRADRWEERDFLRLALLSYAQHQQEQRESEARGSWQAAVASAGNTEASLSVLKDLAHGWGWNGEYIDLLNRAFQRDSRDNQAFTELSRYYANLHQTGELARVYQLHLEAAPDDAEAKSRFAYYSLLINSNLSRAYALAKEGYDAAPADPFRAKAYAFALYRQARAADGWELVGKLGDSKEKGPLQLDLVKAALAAQQNLFKEAKSLLDGFDPSSALPEETELAHSIAKTIAAQNS
jgi:hypothetical protein